MALSEHEQRLLDEMERHLYQNDADVVSTTPRPGSGVGARQVVLMILSVIVGLAIIVGGIALQVPLVGILGFVVMVAGVAWSLTRGRARASADDLPHPGREGAAAPRRAPSSNADGGTFMDRLGDRWDRRSGGEL